MRKELLLIMLIAGLLVVGTQIRDAAAQQPPVATVSAGPVKIGFINIQRAISDSDKGKAVIAKLKTEVDATKAKLDAQKKEVDQLTAEYKAKQATWDEATRQAKADALQTKAKALNRQAQDADDYYQKRQSEVVKPIIQGLNDVILDLGKKENYSAIFEVGGGLLYFSPALEATNKVITNYNLKK